MSWNDSGIDFDPIDDDSSRYTVGFEAFKEFIPDGMEFLSYNGFHGGDISGFGMSDGVTIAVTIAYKDPDEAAVLTVPAGTMGIYADSAIAEKETYEYDGSFNSGYNYGNSTGGSGLGLTGTAADKLKITAAIPDFPENVVNMIKVPAGKYTIEFTALSDEYNNPGAIPITIDDAPGLQSFSIRLEDYTEPQVTAPAPLPEGHTVYKQDVQTVEIILQEKNTTGDTDIDGDVDLVDASAIITYYAGICAGLEPQW